ncbi:hypothetical protein [Pararhodonellum marinum]|uniref:hypothetical protein n=1 Tax=Pararhodonellum marinum TaxID=2755358 RepID=UPI00188F5E09|nr:hypothetical protein [Pararhodonellum marinum]
MKIRTIGILSLKIETSVVDSNTIKLVTEEKDYGDGLVSIKITLNADIYDLFKGEAINFDSGEMIASVDAELFQYGSKHLLKGFWKESIDGKDQFFTWIAIIKKR